MTGLKGKIKELFVSEEGATATEYAVMLALIVAVCIGTVVALGGKVNQAFQTVDTTLGENLPEGDG